MEIVDAQIHATHRGLEQSVAIMDAMGVSHGCDGRERCRARRLDRERWYREDKSWTMPPVLRVFDARESGRSKRV
jgi:hypothetical protein